MLHRSFSACVIAVAISMPLAQAQTAAAPAATRPSAEAFGNLPAASQLALAPDGKHFSLMLPVNGRPAIGIFSTTPGEKPVFIGSPGEGIIDYAFWAKSDRLIIIGKQGLTAQFDKLRTWRRAFSVGLSGKDMVKLMYNMPSFGNNINTSNVIDVNLDDPDHVLMTLYKYDYYSTKDPHFSGNDITTMDVIRTDVRTGKGELIKSGDTRTREWFSDGHGKPIIQIYQTQNPLTDHVLVMNGSQWSERGVFDATGDNGAGILGLSEDGKYVLSTAWDDKTTMQGLVSTDVATGERKPFYFIPGYDVGDVIVDQWTQRILGVTYTDDKPVTHYFDPQRQALQRGLEDAFPGRHVGVISWDAPKTHVIVAVSSSQQPTQFYFLDRTTHQTTLLAETYPGLKENDLGVVKAYPYKARDGLDIPAYLTLPPGKTAKNLPAVILPHGGPFGVRDSERFEWMAQFLANRGYAVLQPNYRGSGGYGHKFAEAGYAQWGLKMQDDITDGVKKLIADGVADPKRICIVGGSYGGYAALAGATFTPDLYACAVSLAGVSDLPMLLQSNVVEAGRQSQTGTWLLSHIGDDLAQLAATSPSRHADKVKAPILLLHGLNDTTVKIEQSNVEAEALKKAGKSVELITFPGEDHQLELASTRIRVLQEMEKFLQQHIGN